MVPTKPLLTYGVFFLVASIGMATQRNAVAQDTIELLNGSTLDGKMEEIRKDAKEFSFRAKIGKRELTRTYSYDQVHAVTFNGKRFVLNPKSEPNADGDSVPEQQASSHGATQAANAGDESRSRAEVLALIDQAGRTPPDWFDATPLDTPDTLDMDWPLKAKGPWNSARNVGQFIWDRVNPNESRWRAGIKLVHECMSRHQSDKGLLMRDMQKLGTMYFTLLQDYPRAAFWLQKSGATVNKPIGIHLAECYWRLGNKQMALAMMRGKALHVSAIKLLGDMGEIDDALRVAEVYGNTQLFNEAFLNAGDALRSAGRTDEALAYYQRVLEAKQARNEDYKQRFLARAAGAIEAIQLFDQADVQRVGDGTYADSSTGYNGKLEVQVEVSEHKITSLKITDHNEKQFYAALTDTPQQIMEKQSIQGIDGTSGATITSQAIIHAAAKALAQGTR